MTEPSAAVAPPRPNMPANFTAPYPAYEAKYVEYTKPLVSCFIGVQDRGGDAASALEELRTLTSSPGGPAVTEQGWHDGTPGARTYVTIAYWRDLAEYEKWADTPRVEEWIGGGLETPLVGRYVERAIVPPHGLDTLIADDETSWGLSKVADRIEITPYHGYWGGTRDRILNSFEDDLANPIGPELPTPSHEWNGIGEIVHVALPKNVVVARGGPDWSASDDAELHEFRSSVYPAYVRGGRYLADNPDEAGCYAAYLLQETDEDGRDVPRNHLIAYFSELSHLERWTRSHPTHLEIYGRFLTMIRKLGGRLPAVNLYHEVTVVPEGGLTATYANCLPDTGLLRFGVRQAADSS